jgi:glycosyltransferase involved in cell wall biosynthesis
MTVSVFIETLNEEKNLPICLRSLTWSDDIVVLDSYSSDKTLDIARDAGARIYKRKFDNRGNHWNWSVQNIEFKYPWVYHCDADEIVTRELADEIVAVTSDANRKEVAYQG